MGDNSANRKHSKKEASFYFHSLKDTLKIPTWFINDGINLFNHIKIGLIVGVFHPSPSPRHHWQLSSGKLVTHIGASWDNEYYCNLIPIWWLDVTNYLIIIEYFPRSFYVSTIQITFQKNQSFPNFYMGNLVYFKNLSPSGLPSQAK